jgi:hypothetical protein
MNLSDEEKLAALRAELAELRREARRALELNYVLRRRLDSVAEERDFERERRLNHEKLTAHAVLSEAERLLREVEVFTTVFHAAHVTITREQDNAWVPTLADGYAYFAERAKDDEGGSDE